MKESEKELKNILEKIGNKRGQFSEEQLRDPNFFDAKFRELLDALEKQIEVVREDNQRLEDEINDKKRREIKPIKLNMEEEE